MPCPGNVIARTGAKRRDAAIYLGDNEHKNIRASAHVFVRLIGQWNPYQE
ncbi:MAG: hypothetical protein PHV06_08380 [bacterium]|nr:hypothetical protein [bacterium]